MSRPSCLSSFWCEHCCDTLRYVHGLRIQSAVGKMPYTEGAMWRIFTYTIAFFYVVNCKEHSDALKVLGLINFGSDGFIKPT
jgi:hypothetical protein